MTKKTIQYISSESVTEGHPDKVCDQIADAILDELLKQDPLSRVACEVVASTGLVLVMGEITTKAYCDIPSVVKKTLRDIGYCDRFAGFDADSCAILTSINEQSPDIALGVNQSLEAKAGASDFTLGAGDQGIMFGYACRDTEDFMPLPITLAHRLCKGLADARKSGRAKSFLPDGKAQVTVCYEDGKPQYIDTVVVSTQHRAEASLEEVKEEVFQEVIYKVLPQELLRPETKYYINPTGRFVVGGPQGDSGLTGRKLIVDTYGGFSRHGGGSFSGKDPTKVDRSASYAARYVAKNLVAAGLADRAEVLLAYAIGVAEPVAIDVDCFGTAKLPEAEIAQIVRDHFDLRPQAIISNFDLQRPLYRELAAYGHFGRPDLDLPWERLDKVDLLRKAAGL